MHSFDTNTCLHDLGSSRYIVVFPDTDDGPSSAAKSGVGFVISFHRASQLGSPPVRVGFGSRTVVGAAVPEAAVHEHCDSCPREDNIRTPPDDWNGPCVDAET
jgi:hypothetical protein